MNEKLKSEVAAMFEDRSERLAARNDAAQKLEQEQKAFHDQFAAVMATVVEPAFREFAEAFRANGMNASVSRENGVSGSVRVVDRPSITLNFGALPDRPSDSECRLSLLGDVYNRKVTFDRVIRGNGTSESGLDGSGVPLTSITAESLQQRVRAQLKRYIG